MIYGFGSLFTMGNNPPASAIVPPFALNSADNGLSVDPVTRHIVLGQDFAAPGNPAAFLSFREVPMSGFGFNMFSGLSNQLSIDPLGGVYHFGQSNAGNLNALGIDDLNRRWFLGEFPTATNLLLHFPGAGIGLSYFDGSGANPFLIPEPGTGGSTFLSSPDFLVQLAMEEITGRAQLGDIGTFGSGVRAVVDGVNGLFIIEDSASNQYLFMNCNPGSEFLNLGKLDGFTSGARLSINSMTGFQRFQLESDGPNRVPLDFDPVTDLYKLGDTFNQNTGFMLTLDVVNETADLTTVAGTPKFSVAGQPGITGSFLFPTQIDVAGGIVTNVV